MSAPESGGTAAPSGAAPAAGAALAACAADVIELAAFRARAAALAAAAAGRGLELPPLGRARLAPERLVLSVRPDRWLLVVPRASPGAIAALWQGACSGYGIAVDHSSGLALLHLSGGQAREVLKRGCRLPLDPPAFPAGSAAATSMAQVAVTLVALPAGWLLLTPASTARHLREWLGAAAQPFGLELLADVTVATLSAEATT